MQAKVIQINDHLQRPERQSDNRGLELKSKYTKLPNWIADSYLPPYELALLTQIARLTIGWNKKAAEISISELCSALGGASKNTVKKTRQSLVDKRMLFVGCTTGGRGAKSSYAINLNYCNDSNNRSGDDHFNDKKRSRDDPFKEGERGQEMTTTGARDDPFSPEKGSGDDHAYKSKNNLKDNSKDTASVDADSSHDVIEKAFDYFWKNMETRKVGKKEAKKAFARIAKQKTTDQLREFLRMILRDQEARKAVAGDGNHPFNKLHPATYLNGERWTDEPEQPWDKKPLETPNKLTLPYFNLSDHGASLQEWANKNLLGFRSADIGETPQGYLSAVRSEVERRNAQ